MNGISARSLLLLLSFVVLNACDEEEKVEPLSVNSIHLGSYELNKTDFSENNAAPTSEPITIALSAPADPSTVSTNVVFRKKHTTAALPTSITVSSDNSVITVQGVDDMLPDQGYVIEVKNGLRGSKGQALSEPLEVEFKTAPLTMEIEQFTVDQVEVVNGTTMMNITPDDLQIRITFSKPLDPTTVNDASIQMAGASTVTLISAIDSNILTITTDVPLVDWAKYRFTITDAIRGSVGERIAGSQSADFYTRGHEQPDFPLIADEALLTLLQQQTFKYFWDFAEPSSGMARERNTSGNLVTSGGSGFGLMAIIVGIERHFITRSEGVQRLDKILSFLEGADRFHGAWSHWLDGTTGNVIPFSPNDNGGDLVETSFLIQGLLTFRQYLDSNVAAEVSLINRINALWTSVEWTWYTRGGEKVLYWHWSPDKEWTMNHQIRGHNETLITYVLAASSPDYSIDASVYHDGYARSGGIKNGKSFYGITLPLGEDYGGPLFFSHYSFLGLDPRNLKDTYADYWIQNTNHTLINQKYCITNPKHWVGYGAEGWGLTASDNSQGYSAHSPTNDLGVITPTAALSSFPYTPAESMNALKFFYYDLGDRLWGDYGFYDAYNLTEGWTADSYLAIDQGPIVVMVENYRTGLLWNLFMSAPEVQSGLTKLGFTY